MAAIDAHWCNGEPQDVYILKLKFQSWSRGCRGSGDFTGSADVLLTVVGVLPLRSFTHRGQVACPSCSMRHVELCTVKNRAWLRGGNHVSRSSRLVYTGPL